MPWCWLIEVRREPSQVNSTFRLVLPAPAARADVPTFGHPVRTRHATDRQEPVCLQRVTGQTVRREMGVNVVESDGEAEAEDADAPAKEGSKEVTKTEG